MAEKKKVNWPAIKKRYLLGEKPASIAKDYEITLRQIHQKAHHSGWVAAKAEIEKNVENSVERDLKKLYDVTLRVHTKFMRTLESQLQHIQNPYLFDGERTNSLFQTAMNNAVKIMLAGMKEEEKPEDEEPPGFLISLDAADQASS